MGLFPDTWNCGLRMHRECRERFPGTADYRSRHASRHVPDARAVMYAGSANQLFPLKLVVGKTFSAFQAHAQPAILRLWQEAQSVIVSVICLMEHQ